MNTIKDISQNVLYKNLILYTNLQQSLILKYKAYSSSDKTSGNVDSVARIWDLIVLFYIKKTQLPLTKRIKNYLYDFCFYAVYLYSQIKIESVINSS